MDYSEYGDVPASPQALLYELVHLIIGQLDTTDKHTLNACSLVCKDWLAMSRSESGAFSTVKITRETSLGFLALIQSPLSSINVHIRTLYLVERGDSGRAWLEEDVPLVAPKLPRVTSLRISAFLNDGLSIRTQTALTAAFGKTLTSLSMMGPRFSSFGDVMRFVCAFRALEHLESLVMWKTDAPPQEDVSLPLHLCSLRLMAWSSKCFMEWAVAHPAVPPISTLAVFGITSVQASVISQFISEIADHLVNISLHFEEDEEKALGSILSDNSQPQNQIPDF